MNLPGEEPEEVEVTREPTPEEQGMFMAVMGTIGPSYIVDAMDKTPEDFVNELRTDIENGDEMSKQMLDFLARVDVESFLELLSLFTNDPNYGTFVTDMVAEEGRVWLLEVTSIIRGQDGADAGEQQAGYRQ